MTDTRTERCERTELLTNQCAHCRPNPEAEALARALASQLPPAAYEQPEPSGATVVTDRYVFKAHFHGWCRACREPIKIGQLITASGESNYVHEECV